MAFNPTPCPGCGGAGGPGVAGAEIEQHLLCDVLPDGSVAGTALAVYEYDATGTPVGAPTFVNPATGAPYVAQGTLMPCPGETGCLDPVQFCFTTTTTGPVEHPGRQYDFQLPISPGFAFDSLFIDGTEHVAGITWAVTDPDGAAFAAAVDQFIQNRFTPLGATVTVTNPNAGGVVCGQALPLQVHIECVRLDEPAPDVVEAGYNGGTDLVVNPAYLTTPPTNLDGPQFVYLRRQDQGGTLNCTNTANRGWETNDLGDANRDFEIWGQGPGGLQTISNTTPTPRGTPVQEITADINDTGPGPTIWQTFNVPVGGNFNVQLVHGARDPGEQHTIRLSTGDTNDTGPGDIINNVTNPPSVTNSGGPNPWTQFSQVVALAPGIYTFSLTTTNPIGNNRGGLFTDMRVFIDVPNQRETAVTDDDTCVVTTEETTTTTTCEWWSPLCEAGDITAWKNAETSETLDNAAFWGQTPSPECCTPATSGGGGGTVTAGNLVHSYAICGVVGGVRQPLSRVVYTDQSGGVLASTIIGPEGGPVAPSTWAPGGCADAPRDVELVELCDVQPGGFVIPFVRVINYDDQGNVVSSVNQTPDGAPYNPTGTASVCSSLERTQQLLCDDGVPFLRVITSVAGIVGSVQDWSLDGITPFVATGIIGDCGVVTRDNESHILCDSNGTQFLRTYTYNQFGGFIALTNTALDGLTPFAPVGAVGLCGDTSVADTRDAELQVLCDANGTRFLRKYLYDGETGAFTTVVNTTLDGTTVFAPVGAVGVCTQPVATDFDFVVLELCDSNGAFLRRLTFNSQTGAVTATTNTTLAGGAYVPVGTVGSCEACCPIVVGQGCSDTGSGRYTALRLTNGTISLVDAVTGAAITPANVVPCEVTVTSQLKFLNATESWTPAGDVTGVLTGVSMTVLTGTANVTDTDGPNTTGIPAGASLRWSVEDEANSLTGPQLINADAASTVLVSWTQKPS